MPATIKLRRPLDREWTCITHANPADVAALWHALAAHGARFIPKPDMTPTQATSHPMYAGEADYDGQQYWMLLTPRAFALAAKGA